MDYIQQMTMLVKSQKYTSMLRRLKLTCGALLCALFVAVSDALAKSKFAAAHETFAGKAEHGPEHLGTGLIIAACIFILIALGITIHILRLRAQKRAKAAKDTGSKTRGRNRPI